MDVKLIAASQKKVFKYMQTSCREKENIDKKPNPGEEPVGC